MEYYRVVIIEDEMTVTCSMCGGS